MATFRLGINYWPARTAMGMWSAFDAAAIDADFARIAAAGLHSVRFFLLWETFQPEPGRIELHALENLERFLDMLAARGLHGMPTFFCGHMSGVNWLPEWTLDPKTPHGRFRTISNGRESPLGIGDFYADPRLVSAQRLAARTIGARFRGHPGIEAWDLGNEFSNLREPANPKDAATWSRVLATDLIETSGKPVTGGIHGEDLERDRGIRPSTISASWEYATMHGYSVYSPFSRGRLDAEVVPFLYEIAGSLSGKRVLFSEMGGPFCPPGKRSPYERVPLPGDPDFGKPIPDDPALAAYACLDEDEMATYASDVIGRLQKRGALGAYWWCYTDYDPALATTPPFDRAAHEMRFGAWRADGSPKPVVATLSRFAQAALAVVDPPAPIADESTYYDDPMRVKDRYEAYTTRL